MKPYYEEGLHAGEVLSQALTKSKTGTVQFVLRCKILGTATEEGYTPASQQYERTVYMAITAGTIDFVVDTLKSIGYEKQSFKYLDPAVDGAHDFTGQQVDLWCKHDEYKGEQKEKWNISRPREQKPVELLSAAELRQLDALFGKALKGGARSAPVKATPQKATAVAEPEPLDDGTFITDDDIPF